jgi:hypothetical protein
MLGRWVFAFLAFLAVSYTATHPAEFSRSISYSHDSVWIASALELNAFREPSLEGNDPEFFFGIDSALSRAREFNLRGSLSFSRFQQNPLNGRLIDRFGRYFNTPPPAA